MLILVLPTAVGPIRTSSFGLVSSINGNHSVRYFRFSPFRQCKAKPFKLSAGSRFLHDNGFARDPDRFPHTFHFQRLPVCIMSQRMDGSRFGDRFAEHRIKINNVYAPIRRRLQIIQVMAVPDLDSPHRLITGLQMAFIGPKPFFQRA